MKRYSEINYWEIFKRSWKISWSNRYLWWFGLLLALSGSGGGGNYSWNSGEWQKNSAAFPKQKIMDFISQNWQWIAVAIGALFILAVIFFILGTIARGALIDSVGKHLNGGSSNFKSGFQVGRKNFWKIFFIRLALGLFILSAILVLASPVVFLFFNKSYFVGTFMAVLAALIIIPLLILIAYTRIFGYIYAVAGPLKFWPAIEKAADLFQKNLGASIIMGLLFIPLNILMIIASFMLIIPVAGIFFLLGLLLYFTAGQIGIYIAGGIGLLVILVVMLLVRAFWEVFVQSAWLLFFHEIAKPSMPEIVTEIENESESSAKVIPVIEAEKN